MSNTLITGLAVAGVIAAGAAAAAVNTTIFAGGDGSSESAAAAIITPAAGDPVPAAETPDAATPDTASSTSAVAAEAGTTEFRVGDAGTVTVATTEGRLTIVDAAPNPGWTVVETEEEDGEIEVVLRSPDTTVEFEAELVDGEIVTWIDAWANGAGNTTGIDHDESEHDEYEDDHDEYVDDEYEDDEYEDDHDEYEDDEDDEEQEDD